MDPKFPIGTIVRQCRNTWLGSDAHIDTTIGTVVDFIDDPNLPYTVAYKEAGGRHRYRYLAEDELEAVE